MNVRYGTLNTTDKLDAECIGKILGIEVFVSGCFDINQFTCRITPFELCMKSIELLFEFWQYRLGYRFIDKKCLHRVAYTWTLTLGVDGYLNRFIEVGIFVDVGMA